MPFHGSLCDLITYREHVPVRICVVFQNPTWFLISYCLAGSSVPVHGLTVQLQALEMSGREACAPMKQKAWGPGSRGERVPLGPWRSPPIEACVIDSGGGAPFQIYPGGFSPLYSVSGYDCVWGGTGQTDWVLEPSVREGWWGRSVEGECSQGPCSWREGGGRRGKGIRHREDLPCARRRARCLTCLLCLLLIRTLRGKHRRPISQIWKPRHREVLSALAVSSH